MKQDLKQIRVLLADDNAVALALAERVLTSEFQVVKAVGDGQSLIDEAKRLDPDVLVLDISMPAVDGIEAARRLTEAGTRARIVFLTMHENQDYVRSALAAGGQGYVVKSRMASDLVIALKEALAGRLFISPSISPKKSA
jgi:DNA-binding NarL/FixJ family response regulator